MTTTLKAKRSYSLRTSRGAVVLMFFVNGAIFANWAARIPEVQAKLHLTEGGLGFVLLGISAGVLFALSLAGGLIGRYSSRKVTTVAGVLLCLLLPLAALATNGLLLFIALFLIGSMVSTMDVAMNAQAIELEKRYAKTIMNSFHAAWSLGGVAGASFGGLLAGMGVSVLAHFVVASAILLILLLLASMPLLNIEGETDQKDTQAVFSFPQRVLWPLGIVAFCAAISEGAMIDWTAVFLRKEMATTVATAALGFAIFSAAMTTGRLLGDWVTTKVTPEWLVRAGGLLGAAGLALSMSVNSVPLVLLGFGLLGIGMSVVIPLVFSAAGKLPDIPSGLGVAGVATIGYAGFLAGPPLIGLIADATSLRLSLLLIALLAGSLFFTGRSMRLAE